MTKDLADELERLAKALFDEPDAARRIYRSVALSLWVENNLPRIISALRREEPASLTREGEPVAWRRRGKNLRWEYLDDGSSSVVVSEWAPLYTRPVACPDRPALDVPALQREVAGIIVRDVLQEEYDDLVEGYLDEIMRASLRIIRLPGYSVVARAFETNLSGAVIASSASASRIEELERDNARLRDRDEEVREELADAWPEDREAVLAGDPAPLIAKLIRQRDEAICEHEHTRQALSDKG